MQAGNRNYLALRRFSETPDEEPASLDGLDDCHIRDRNERIALIEENVLRAFGAILKGMNRDHERCGKAACARARRCRGFACEPGARDVRTAAARRG